ncbi:hypothetical protein M409DRAFT_24308 [Zasmidium cellare ATCC 36951]|uniref:Uncharacterized protein n=1 Tax=Zasmidium cellare ATCC 36951 TaxID=1080233 RepID=A0A6A6CH01_ZASCE|nr:uncharacterized protein M409DRAFT_24308 [Zasmidium cellare ATCC 36951]KAF2165458.1 hypothetical protein M409DRAFT_24308 [Zasmidium cellare ATCC 36951]
MADHTATNTMPHYAPNTYIASPPAGTRSRGSSAASRYVPDNYPIPPPTSKDENNQLLAPPSPNSQPEPDAQAFTPIRPEQYRPPPDTRGIPPAQLRPYHPDAYMRSKSDGYESRRSGDVRRSFDSRYSDDPRRSYHSTRSHRSSHDDSARRREYERRRDQEEAWEDEERRREARRRKSSGHLHHDRHHHHHHRDDEDGGKPLRRRDTPRGYGSSLFAVFDHIKNAWKG